MTRARGMPMTAHTAVAAAPVPSDSPSADSAAGEV